MTSSVKSRPKFRLIEGNSTEEFTDIYDEFKEDYLNKHTTVDYMLSKYNLSKNSYKRLRKIVAEETGINRKPSKYNTGVMWDQHEEFIDRQKSTGRYRVSKVINGKYYHFGVYHDLSTAVYIRDELMKHDWDVEHYKLLRYKLYGVKDKSNDERIKEIYDDFKIDFMNGESMKYLMGKYSLTITMYKTMSKMVREEEGIFRKPQMSPKIAKQHEVELYATL